MREPSEEIDFGPAEPEGRSQTRPVEVLGAHQDRRLKEEYI